MADDLSVAFERLRLASRHFNKLCDTANDVIRDVEHFLEETQVGLSVSVSLGLGADSSDATEPEWEEYLAYRRMPSGKFRIVVGRTEFGGEPRSSAVRPWSECSREEKMEALVKLPELMSALTTEIESRTAVIEKAIATLGNLSRLPKSRKGGDK